MENSKQRNKMKKLDFTLIGYSGHQRMNGSKGGYKYYFYRYMLLTPIENPMQYTNVCGYGVATYRYAPEIQNDFIDIYYRKVKIKS